MNNLSSEVIIKADEVSGYIIFFLPNRDFLNRFHNSSRYDIVEEVSILCKSLDEVLHEGNLTDIDFIKLDTIINLLLIRQSQFQSGADSKNLIRYTRHLQMSGCAD
jgi:hypothetical protein